ncbi:hypothetical protein, partial [Actinomadura sp. CNU-125]|uniref:hypothetical protein n=1 Tax=Actinomadura sp. CNU-125 TaxID=1904961 RepID=UPI0021CCD035
DRARHAAVADTAQAQGRLTELQARVRRAEQTADQAADRADRATARADTATDTASRLRTALALPMVTDIGDSTGVPLTDGAGAVLADDGMLTLQRVGDRHSPEAGLELARAITAVAHTLR